MTLEVKNPPTNAGDVREAGSIADKDPLEEGMANSFLWDWNEN